MRKRLLMLLSVFMMVTSVGWLHAQKTETGPSIDSDLRFAKPGVPVVLGITTKQGDVAGGTMVRVKLDVTKNGSNEAVDLAGWKLRYYEKNPSVEKQGWRDWTPEEGVYMFGPKETGFPFMDATSYVEVTAPAGSEGLYQVNLTALKVGTSESVITMPISCTVTANPVAAAGYQGTPMASIGNTDYASIYSAVLFAKDNDVIQLTKGNYSLYKSLVITKPLTINGAGVDQNGSAFHPRMIGEKEVYWETPAGIENVNDYKHLIVIGGAAEGTVKLQNMNVTHSVASGINAQSAMTTVLNKVGLIQNANAGLLAHSKVEATGIYTVDNVWGGVNIDQGRTAYAPSFTFDATSSFAETAQIWSELVSADAGQLVSAPAGWRNYIPADKTGQRFWTNKALTSEFYQTYPNKTDNKGYTFVYANGNPITIQEGSEGNVKITVDGSNETLEVASAKNPVIFGGAKNATVKSSRITMLSGKVMNIFGGGYGEVATATKAVVEDSTIIIVKGGNARNLLGGGLYYSASNIVDISISGLTMDAGAWVFCGGQESGKTSGKNYPTFEEAANTLHKGKLTITGGTFGYIAIGGTDGTKGYTQDVGASISGATILGGVFGNGSNGGSDKVVGTITNCKFTGTDMEIAAVNRGVAKDVSLTFKDCTFPEASAMHANLGATYKWKKNYASSDSKIDGVPGSVAFTFINCGANTPVVGLSDGLATANVTLTGAKAKIAKFTYDEGKTTDSFTIGDGKTWAFNEGLAVVASGDAATLTNKGTLVIPTSDIMAGIAAGGALQVNAASKDVIAAMNAADKKEDLSEKNITIACTDGIIATNKEIAKELLKAGKSVLTLAYNEEDGYSVKVYIQQLAAITNLPASVVYGTAPVKLAFNMEGVTATSSDANIATIADTVLTILKPGTVTLTLKATDDEASSTQTLEVTKRTLTLTGGITVKNANSKDYAKEYDGEKTGITLEVGTLEYSGALNTEEPGLTLKATPTGVLADANAGDKKAVVVTAELNDSTDYYTLAPITFVTAKVAPKAITIKANDVSANYGTAASYTAEKYSLVEGEALEGTLKFDCAATATSPEGTYDIKPYGLSNPNYAITYTKGTLTIAAVNPTVKIIGQEVKVNGQKRDITVTAQITDLGGAKKVEGSVEESVSFTYNNAKETLNGTRNADGTYSATKTVDATNATYSITATATVTGTAAKTSEASNEISIAIDGLTPQNIAFDKSVVSTLMYGKTMKLAATGSVIANAAYTYELADGSDAYASLADGVLTANKVGEITIVAKQEGDETHSAATVTKTIQITPQPITVKVGAMTKTYDGTTAVDNLPTFTLEGQKAGAKVSVTRPQLNGFAFASKNVGSYSVSCPTLTLEGEDAINYTLVQPKKEDVKGSITKAPLSVKVNDVKRMYNDRYTKYTFNVIEGQLFKGETLTSAYSGTFDVKENGETLELSVEPKLCPNYDLRAVNGKLTVDKGTPVAVVFGTAGKITPMLIDPAGYNGLKLEVSEDGTFANILAEGSTIGASINSIKAVPQPISLLSGRMLTKTTSDWDNDNVSVAKTYGDASFSSKYDESEDYTYLSSNTNILTVSQEGEVTINGTGDAAIVAMKAGEAHVIKYQVGAKTLDVKVADMNKTYDGTTLASGTIALGEDVKGVDVALEMSDVSFNYASKDAAEGVTVNPSQALILTGTAANNYELKVTLTGTILQKDLNITSVSKYYDGLPTATLTDYATSDLVSGDIVPATVTFDKADIDAVLKSVAIDVKSNYALKSVATKAGGVVTAGSILKSTIIAKLPIEGSSVSNVKNNITLKVKETGADITNASAIAAIKKSIDVTANGNEAYFVSAVANDNFTVLFDGSQQIGYRAEEEGGDDDVTVTGITLDKTELTLQPQGTYTLKATLAPSTVTGKTISWTSSNDQIATVDADGNVTAVAIGEATITASVDGKSATCKVTVTTATALEEAIANTRVYGKDGSIRIEPQMPMDVMVVNMVGVPVYKGHIDGASQIAVSVSGIYIVKLGTGGEAKVHKVSVK